MSSDSNGSKNDPLFERLFAEAEACLDKNRKDSEPAGELGEPTALREKESSQPSVGTSEKPSTDAKRLRMQRSASAGLGQLPLGARLRQQTGQARSDDGQALALAEAKITKLQQRLGNIKDRAKRDQEMALSKQKDKMLGQFLALLDDLERALSSELDTSQDNQQFEAYQKGIQQVYEGGQHLLGQFGVTRFESVGEPFDPNLHEAVRREPRTDMSPNLVVEVFQAGYMLDERLLRAARVSVSASVD